MTGTAISPYGVPRPAGKDLYGTPEATLLRAADEIAGGRRGVNQVAFGGALAR